jgi:hypothetical protein
MLDRVHKISEIVAAFALVASLVFVGVQISQNTSTMRTESHQTAVNVWANLATPLITDERLAALYSDDLYAELSPTGLGSDELSLSAYVQNTFFVIESHYLRWLDGDLPDEVWSGFRTGLFETMVQLKSGMVYWTYNHDNHSTAFQKLVDKLIPAAEDRRKEIAARYAMQPQ